MQHTLNLLPKFKCIGQHCPDNCCHSWRAELEQTTLDKWQAITDAQKRERLLNSYSRSDTPGAEPYIVNKLPNGDCVFLENGICWIHEQLGHELLPFTCQVYPRITESNEILQLKSAHLSCPEMARLLVEVAMTESAPAVTLYEPNLPSSDTTDQPELSLGVVAKRLEAFKSLVLQQTTISLNIRLYYIADTLAELTHNAMSNKLDSQTLKKIIRTDPDAIKKQLTLLGADVHKNKLKVNKQTAGKIWHVIARLCRILDNPRLANIVTTSPLMKLLNSSQANETNYPAKLTNHILDLNARIHNEMPALAGLFTNYLQVSFMNNGFAWRPFTGNFTATFMNSLIMLAQIQLLLYATYEVSHSINQDEIVRIIYLVEKSLSHNHYIYQNLQKHAWLLDLNSNKSWFLSIWS